MHGLRAIFPAFPAWHGGAIPPAGRALEQQLRSFSYGT